MSSNKNGKNYVPYASRTEISLAVLFGCLAILLYVLLSALTDIPVSLLATGVILLYLLSILAIAFFHASNVRVSSSYGIYSLLSEEGAVVLKNTASPVLVIDAFGKILWYNEAARAVFPDRENYIDRAVSELFGEAVVPEFFTDKETELFGRRYRMESYRISSGEEGLTPSASMTAPTSMTSPCATRTKRRRSPTSQSTTPRTSCSMCTISFRMPSVPWTRNCGRGRIPCTPCSAPTTTINTF